MICVYPPDCTDFSTNGLGVLAPQSAQVTETLNGEYELTLVQIIDVNFGKMLDIFQKKDKIEKPLFIIRDC